MSFKRILHYTNQNDIFIRDSVIEAFVQNVDIHRYTQGCLFDSGTLCLGLSNSVIYVPLCSLFDSGTTINLFS